MGRIIHTTQVRFRFIGTLVFVVCVLAVLSGCSTASWIIHHNPKADALIITEDDVDVIIDELSGTQPSNPGVVVYNGNTDRYELTPDTYRKAIKDGIVRRIQDKKIREFLETYRPEGFFDAFRKDMGMAGFVILILGVVGGLLY
jgi:hypothetical protein